MIGNFYNNTQELGHGKMGFYNQEVCKIEHIKTGSIRLLRYSGLSFGIERNYRRPFF